MQPFSNLNDGTQNPPRLQVGHALWSLIKLPMNAPTEWTLDEKFERVAAAGFKHVECWLSNDDAAETKALLDKHGLQLILGHRPTAVEHTRDVVDLAVRHGAIVAFAQPATAYTPLEDVARIVREGSEIAAGAGIGYFVETHRGNFTENIPQTLSLLEAVPEIRFTADLSHFVTVGEFYGWEGENALEHMAPILDRCSHAHARISSGEQVQVHVEPQDQAARFFVSLWTRIFSTWRKAAQPGDVFPFSSELGPPKYAITLPDGSEFSDRWEQSLVMKTLAEEAWAAAA